jgi:hypothetical protein
MHPAERTLEMTNSVLQQLVRHKNAAKGLMKEIVEQIQGDCSILEVTLEQKKQGLIQALYTIWCLR